ncbi:GspH/FimT family pseudopilin [Luteimonas huabeiensis]|uniref:GspH/FimT family pseudopilin n=1 Tax=Luteimonas huabeiensis TaxID=1244513 RepID=UPI000464E2C3|nr:GspH/FimT family protein [Luteimonas huabeiensis]
MPAHGTRRPGAIPPAAAAGFTLVELMATLAVIGLLAAAVALTAPAPVPALRRDAEALAGTLARAREEAILGGRRVRVEADPLGYRVAVARSGGWQPLSAPPFAPVRWRDGVTPALADDPALRGFAFDPLGGAEPAALELAQGGRRARVEVAIDGSVHLSEAR